MKNTNKILFENIFSMSAIQILNYLIPLITLPYLVRVLGVEKYGLINFASAFINYFILITDYGFNLSAVRQISIYRNEKKKLDELISSIYLIKTILFLISTVIFFIIISSFQIFYSNYKLYLYSYFMIIGNILLPIWFFQGIEDSKYIALVTFLIKLIWVLLIFILITSSKDFLLFVILNSSSSIIIGLILFLLIKKKFKINFIIPSNKILIHQLKESGVIFISTCAINLYTISNTFILGIFTSNTIVGYFSAADKIRVAIQNIITPVTQSTYPHVSNLFSLSIKNAKIFIMNLLKYVGTISFILSLLLYLLTDKIVYVILGPQYFESTILLRIISFLPFIIFLSNLFGIQTMINLDHKKEFTIVISIAALINLALSILVVPKYHAIGTAISMFITEVFVAFSFIYFVFKKGLFKQNEI